MPATTPLSINWLVTTLPVESITLYPATLTCPTLAVPVVLRFPAIKFPTTPNVVPMVAELLIDSAFTIVLPATLRPENTGLSEVPTPISTEKLVPALVNTVKLPVDELYVTLFTPATAVVVAEVIRPLLSTVITGTALAFP